MGSKPDLHAWWFNIHQRGVFMHCLGSFWPCFAANIEASLLGEQSHGPAYMWHWRHVSGTECVNRTVARARHIRELGWGG